MDQAGSSSAPTVLLPDTGISRILGFIELLKSKGGKEDIYKLAAELKMEYGEMLSVIRGAEMLKLVNTPGGDVVLEALGEKLSKSKVKERKELIRKQLLSLPIYSDIYNYLNSQEGFEASRDAIIEKLSELVPGEDAEGMFKNLVYWGRYAELFGYNADRKMFYLDQVVQTPAM